MTFASLADKTSTGIIILRDTGAAVFVAQRVLPQETTGKGKKYMLTGGSPKTVTCCLIDCGFGLRIIEKSCESGYS